MYNIQEVKSKTPVIIIDDDAEHCRALSLILNSDGVQTVCCKTGKEALDLSLQQDFNVAILDLKLPDIDGIQLLRQLKQRHPRIKVIIHTGFASTDSAMTALNQGAFAYMKKAGDVEDLLNYINNALLAWYNDSLEEEIKKQNKERVEANEKLRKLNANKDKIFTIIAHDLINPFSSLMGLSKLLATEMDTLRQEDIKTCASKIYSVSEHLFDLLKNLLEWAKIQINQAEFQPTTQSLQSMIEHNSQPWIESAKQKNIKLTYEGHENVMVYADQEMVSLILRNLISNATKFTGEGGEIKITANVQENDVEISVTDTGVGINAKNIEKLFRIDEHYTTGGTADEKGTGLGLILCKDLLDKNKGRIWVESTPGKGTSFTFSLPRFNQSLN